MPAPVTMTTRARYPTAMQRGDLQWLITIPDDGKPLMGGTAPALIEWKTGPHPASRQQDQGLHLLLHWPGYQFREWRRRVRQRIRGEGFAAKGDQRLGPAQTGHRGLGGIVC